MLYRFTLLTLLAGLCLGQDAARKEITLDPQTLSQYVGAYQMGNGNGPVMLVTLENHQLFTKLGAQQAIPIYPESKTMFFPKVVNAEIEFAKYDDKGRPAELILHQNGRDMACERVDDAKAKALADAAAAFDKRFKDKTAAPGGEAALRKMAEDFASGKQNSDAVSAGFADNPQLAQVRSQMSRLGAVQLLVFKDVGPAGPDIYSVRFEKGALETRIWLGLDGKIENTNAHPEEGGVGTPVASLRPHFAAIDSLAAAELARRPVGSVTAGVVSGKELVWSKSYGEADMEKKTAADADTVYRIGSITKMFTAVMLEQLVEAKKVHLSDPVEKYFPEIKLVQDRFPDAPPITLIQLATHTSGLGREPDDTATYVTGAVKDWEKTLIAALPHTHYVLEPGTRFSYSNIGFAILGAALARAAGEPYTEYVPKHIFKPLGMTHSALEGNAVILPHLAKGYAVMGPNGGVDSETAQREGETGRGYKVPNGAIYTTVGDMSHFASFLMGQGPQEALKIATLENFQLQLIVPADLALTHGYGIGFETERREGYTEFGHGGAVAGYTASLQMNRKAGVGVIVFSSGAANPDGIAQQALDILSK
jgi:CubicO group peptidase (beta-lactamase class C family)